MRRRIVLGLMSAAAVARRRRPDLEIVALEKGVHTSYSACGIPYVVGGEVAAIDDLATSHPGFYSVLVAEAVTTDLMRDALRAGVRDVISLPVHAYLDEAAQDRVIQAVRDALA